LETNPLRSSDAIQIASALAWHSDMFVSADARQCAVAKTSGLSVIKL
jgi:predicted nucleic acid-binding protein